MQNKHYYLTPIGKLDFEDAGTNRRKAVQAGRERAAAEKCSYELWQARPVEGGGGRLGRYFVGMLEFPYYLRDVPGLDWHDVGVNLL